MINTVYLIIFLLGGTGVTSQSIPQANMNQCQINAKVFNIAESPIKNGYSNGGQMKAYCIVGVK